MRKRYRDKKGSACGMCKPNKRGGAIRFKAREFEGRKRAEAEILEVKKKRRS